MVGAWDQAAAKVGPPIYNVDNYRQIIAENPDDPKVAYPYLAIGFYSSYHIYRQYDAAAEAYRAIVDQFPDSPLADDALWYLARLYEQSMEDFAKAGATYRELARLYHGVRFEVNPVIQVRPRADMTEDELLAEADRIDSGIAEIAAIEAKLEKMHSDGEAITLRFALADACLALGGLNGAEEELGKIVDLFPLDEEAVARAKYQMGRLYDVNWTERIADPFNRYIFGVSGNARVSRQTQLLQKALEYYEPIARLYGKTAFAPKALFRMGMVYTRIGYEWQPEQGSTDFWTEKTGDYRRAVTVFEQLLREYPDSELVPAAMLELGRAYRQMNNRVEARLIWAKLIEMNAKSSAAQQAQKELQEMEKGE
ncbi:MAG: tetratricopeptide repeat protein [Thermodesulfobacteriota bacterium]